MHDLLMERLIGVVTENGAEAEVSLPGLMALMMRNEVGSITAMRTHHRQALHSFIVQLGAMAMEGAGLDVPPVREEEWRALLLAMTGEDHRPWEMFVEDPMMPAFMQPPARSRAALNDFAKKFHVHTPGSLDILVSSKNHDIKQNQVQNARPEDWVMALISLQTMENASGQGHKGVSRIRDGTASRPALSLMPAELNFGGEVRRDILALLEKLPKMREEHPWYPERGGLRLLWTEPWDGTEAESLPREAMDILYIDVGKRARMRLLPDGKLGGSYALSKKPRIQREPQGGVTGDPWAPVDLKNGMVLKFADHPEDLKRGITSGRLEPGDLQPSEGFSYRNLVQMLLSADWKLPALLEPTEGERETPGPMRLVGRCISRYQGKTFGYLERQVMLTPRFQETLYDGEKRQEAGAAAMERVLQAAQLQGGLGWAIRIYMNGGKKLERGAKPHPDHVKVATRAVKRMESAIDRGFFDSLQEEMEARPEDRAEIRRRWFAAPGAGIFDEARVLLRAAMEENPQGARKQHRAEAAALGAFERWLRSDLGFPEMFPPRGSGENEQEPEGGKEERNQDGNGEETSTQEGRNE